MADITVSAVTMMGQKHRGRGVPCEDASIAVQKNGVSCVVVCDGAGSKQYTHARFGSKCACETISALLTDHFDSLYNENREAAVRALIIAAIHVEFAKLMEQHGLDNIERLSCTLLFCAVKDRRVMVGHIGDGLIAGVSSTAVYPITMPQNGTNASSTYFVTAPHAADYLRFIKTTTDNLHGIALMTDGVQDSVYDENSGLVRPVVARMIDTAAAGRQKSEAEINSILEKYIVGASNNSDDASFGILLFEGTQGPTGKLPDKAAAFPKSEETFKDLQNAMVPAVKRARKMILGAAATGGGSDKSNEEKQPVKKGEREEAAEETKVKIKTGAPDKGTVFLVLIAAIELIMIILLIVKLIIDKG